LFCLVAQQFFRVVAPANFRMPPADASAGAGGIEKDAVKKHRIGGGIIAKCAGKERRRETEALAVSGEQFPALGIRFDGGDPGMRKQLGDGRGFAAQPSAGVKDIQPVVTWAKQGAGQLRRLVLNVEPAFGKAWQVGDGSLIARQQQSVRSVVPQRRHDAGLGQQGLQLCRRAVPGVDPQRKRRLEIAGGADAAHFLFAETLTPAFAQPCGMIEKIVGMRQFVLLSALPDSAAQTSIQDGGQMRRQAKLFRRRYRFVDRRRFGNACEEDELIETNRQRLVQCPIKFLQRMAAQPADQRLNILPLPQDAIDNIHRQAAIGGAQRFSGKIPERRRLLPKTGQRRDGGGAWVVWWTMEHGIISFSIEIVVPVGVILPERLPCKKS